jgi:hypothetical protein
MLNTIILEKVRLLRALLADVEMDTEDRELLEDLLRDIEEQARK